MDMPNELYVATFTEYVEDHVNPACIIGIFGDAERARAAVMADMNEFAEDMDVSWTIDKSSKHAWNTKINASIKWGVEAASVDY